RFGAFCGLKSDISALRGVPCVDGSELAREIVTFAGCAAMCPSWLDGLVTDAHGAFTNSFTHRLCRSHAPAIARILLCLALNSPNLDVFEHPPAVADRLARSPR